LFWIDVWRASDRATRWALVTFGFGFWLHWWRRSQSLRCGNWERSTEGRVTSAQSRPFRGVCATCSGLQVGVRGHPRPAWLGGGGLLGPEKCGRTPLRPPVLYTSRPQLDGKCTLIRKSQHSIPRYGAHTGGAQRSSRAPYYGGATHITPRFRKKSPYYGVGANRWACS